MILSFPLPFFLKSLRGHKSLWLLGSGLFALPLSPLNAEEDLVALLAPKSVLSPGQVAEVTLLATNAQNKATTWIPPATMPGRLVNNGGQLSVTLQATTDQDILIAAGGFASRHYRLTLPPEISGRTTLEVIGADGLPIRTLLDVAANPGAMAMGSPAAGDAAGVAPSPPDMSVAPPADANSEGAAGARNSFDRGESGRTFLGRVAAHEPVYFIYGGKKPAAKFQFSFKYRLATLSPEGEDTPSQTVQFAYTQLSLWDTQAQSSPFYDTQYQPEFIYERLSFAHPASLGPLHWYGFQAGYRHESNGQGGDTSRSLNVLYARPVVGIGDINSWHLLLFPQAYAYVASLGDNRDIKDYLGYAEIRGVIGTNNSGPLLGFTERAGKKFNHHTHLIDLTFPVRIKALDTSFYLLVQYFRGYGESLRSYNQRSEELRAGVSLVR